MNKILNAKEYYNRGNTKVSIEDYQGAIADYTKAIEIDSKYVFAYNNRAYAKSLLKNIDGACLDWSKASELGDVYAYDLMKKYCN